MAVSNEAGTGGAPAQQGSNDQRDNPANNEIGKAVLEANGYGAPNETASMSCADKKTCDLVFILPSKDTVRPFGLAVKLVSADEKQAVISVAGKQYVVKVGKALKIKGATIKVVGIPGSVVTLNFQST